MLLIYDYAHCLYMYIHVQGLHLLSFGTAFDFFVYIHVHVHDIGGLGSW